MPHDSDARTVLSHFRQLGELRRLQSLGDAGGFSGTRLWRVETVLPGGPYCLRRWPREHPTPERLQFIHAVLRHVGQQGIDFIPIPLAATLQPTSTIHFHAGHLWEVTPWLPGQADYQARPSRLRLAAAFQALARFHAAAESFPRERMLSSTCPTIEQRRERLLQLQLTHYEPIALAVRNRSHPLLADCGNSLLQLFPLQAPAVAAGLAAAAKNTVPLQPAIRDVWHDHVLFTGDDVTGIIDFGALRIDTPLADVARLLGSLAGDDAAAREFALESYAALRPLSYRDRDLIELFDFSGTLLAGFSWLEWIYLDRRQFRDLTVVARRLHEIVARLQRRPDP